MMTHQSNVKLIKENRGLTLVIKLNLLPVNATSLIIYDRCNRYITLYLCYMCVSAWNSPQFNQTLIILISKNSISRTI